MTITILTLADLKHAKNAVIGNPTAKRALAGNEPLVAALVDCVQDAEGTLDSIPELRNDMRIEAAHIIASISYGSDEALRSLLKAEAPNALLIALSNLTASDPPALKSAIARALRVLAVAIAEAVGPSQWGLQQRVPDTQKDPKDVLDALFEPDALDVYLPLLLDPSPQTRISIAQLIANAVRLHGYRQAVSDWLPAAERNQEVKGKRGWEKTDVSKTTNKLGGWTSRQLSALLLTKDVKVQEAALSALAALAKDNRAVAAELARAAPEQPPVLATVLSMCKSRITDQQIAACLCATSIIRAAYRFQYPHVDQKAAMTVLHVVNDLISSESDSSQTRTKACYILYNLVADDKELCQLAYERCSLAKLANLVKAITPSETTSGWDEDEPESVASLREAALTAIAAISLFDNDIRSEVTDTHKLIPYIQTSLTHRHVGVRYAACQCARALSRAVSVLRTNIIDSGLGLAVYDIFCKEDEDIRVRHVASSVICNLVPDFSPLREALLEQGIIGRLVALLGHSEPGLALNALWTFKNLLYKCKFDTKREVTSAIGWDTIASLLVHENTDFQEQAFHVIRNIADSQPGIELVFSNLGSDRLLSALSDALESSNDSVVKQAAYVLGNIANSTTHHREIISHPCILVSLRQCLVDRRVDVRRPAVACVRELIRANPHIHKELHETGIDMTLKHMCDYGGGLMASSPTSAFSHQMGVEEDREVRENAREALRWLEHGGDPTMI